MAAISRKRYAVGSTSDYEQTRVLGEGKYGTVAMARHRVTGQAVAIKRLGEAGGHSAVIRETEFLEACRDNPFVVGFHGLVRAPGSMELRIALEYVGPSLRDLFLKRRDDAPPLPETTVRKIMWQLLMGVKKMHALGIMHRDIKPENILLSDRRKVVKICDFGIAMHMSDAPPYAQVGTTCYMAPEVLLEKPDYDALADTWSLGCVMAELVGGEILFNSTSDEAQFCTIMEVLGAPTARAWPWFASTEFATKQLPKLESVWKCSQLRRLFPKKMLSQHGHEVLRGLLTWNPDKRLTASAALKHPWFAGLGGPAPAPARKEEMVSAASRKRVNPLIDPPRKPNKRRKLHCA